MTVHETEESVSVSGVNPGTNGDSPNDIEQFNARVDRLLEMIAEDPTVRDRMLAELYINFANVELMFRQITQTLQEVGPAGLFKSMMGRKGRNG